MRGERIVSLLGSLGCTRITNTGVKVRSSCPLAPFRHSSGKDSHPSFMVFVEDADESHCRCLGGSCNFRGTLTQLVWAYAKHAKIDVSNYLNFIRLNEQFDLTSKLEKIDLGIFSKRDSLPGAVTGGIEMTDVVIQADSINGLEAFQHVVGEMQGFLGEWALDHLHNERGLNDESIARWKLGWHPGARRIACPQYDRNGRLVNIGGRYLPYPDEEEDPNWKPPKWMHATGFRKEYYLFGEDRFLSFDGTGTIVLCEGMFDAIYLDSRGIPNVAAVLGSFLNPPQFKKVIKWFNRAVIVPDGDKAGYSAASTISDMLSQKIEVVVYPTPMHKDPDQLTESEIEDLKSGFVFDNKSPSH